MTQTTTEGVGRLVLDLVRDQVGRGWQVSVASPRDDVLERACADAGATHHAWPATRSISARVVTETRALRRIVDRAAPDVVDLHSSKAGLVGRLAIRGRRPTVFTPSAWSFLHEGRLLRSLSLRWERWGARWADAILCVSEAERARGEEAGIRATWRVVPNAVDLEAFRPATSGERDVLRSELGMGPGPTVVCIGRLAPQKGQDVLLDAWPAVRGSVAGAALVLVGDGPDRDELEPRAGPDVRFVGRRDDVRSWLVAADVVAQPSRWEGMSIATLETIACGASLVASDVDGMREILGSGDDAVGALVPPDDAAALARAIIGRLSDPGRARDEGGRARERAADFDLKEWGTRVAAVLEAAAAR